MATMLLDEGRRTCWDVAVRSGAQDKMSTPLMALLKNNLTREESVIIQLPFGLV